MPLLLPQAKEPTQRIALKVGNEVFAAWTAVEIVRDLVEMSGSFRLECHDLGRAGRAMPVPASASPLEPGQAAVLSIDGEVVLTGWIDEVNPIWSGEKVGAIVSGRDRTGDLVDCAAAPQGPAEYANLTLTQIAERICKPFGIPVRAEVDVGRPFARFAIDVAETALSAIEKAARQRAVLVTSDGVGGLVLTRGGQRRGPAPLRVGELIQEIDATLTWRGRYSDYWVKGQSEKAAGRRGSTPALDATAGRLTDPVPPAPAARMQAARAGVVMTGHARDPVVTRYRPTVRQAKTQSGGASCQEQADWMARVARGKAEALQYSVADWRAGEENRLWRPNELVLVDDPYTGVLGDRLVSAVVYGYGPRGATTKLKLSPRDAFDLVEEAEERRASRQRRQGQALDSTARPLQRTSSPPGGSDAR